MLDSSSVEEPAPSVRFVSTKKRNSTPLEARVPTQWALTKLSRLLAVLWVISSNQHNI